MINFYENINANPKIRKIGVDDPLFAEYICPIGKPLFPIWTQHDYVVHVISGKKAWRTPVGVKWYLRKRRFTLRREPIFPAIL